ncbi:MAG: hypothetical protein QHG99_08025 [Methanomicrobiales archaeon]|nr:hypothetical protein [Methanomicrobiales archaeon]
MNGRRRVTEADLKLTERMISESYVGLKRAAVQAPERAAEVAVGKVKEHPLIALALVAGAGVAGFGILKWALSCSRGEKKRESGSKLMDVLIGLLPMALPHLIGLLEQILGGEGRSRR